MEEKNVNVSNSGGTPASSRWNPTKEQISMLEVLYNQGIRTPSAEQIQQITSRLKAFGHIEGKNVFYWFQNHKARQRQKQKQENMVYMNRYLHKFASMFALPPPSPCSNVVCNSFYLPHYPKVILPGSIRSKPSTDKVERMKDSVGGGCAGYEPAYHNYDIMYTGEVNEENMNFNHNNNTSHETLELFPLHPTGVFEGGTSRSFFATSADHQSFNPSSSSEKISEVVEEGSGDQPFFDFFAQHGS